MECLWSRSFHKQAKAKSSLLATLNVGKKKAILLDISSRMHLLHHSPAEMHLYIFGRTLFQNTWVRQSIAILI